MRRATGLPSDIWPGCTPSFVVPDKPAQKRTYYFPNLRTPTLFVHGTKDPFGLLEELHETLALIPARTDLLPVEGAAHDLKRAAGLASDIWTRLYAVVCYPET